MKNCAKFINSRSREEWEALIHNWVHNRRDREMLMLRMLDGEDYSDIAERYFISAEYCRQRVESARNQVFSHVEIIK